MLNINLTIEEIDILMQYVNNQNIVLKTCIEVDGPNNKHIRETFPGKLAKNNKILEKLNEALNN